MLPVREFSTAAEMRAHYVAVRHQLDHPRPKPLALRLIQQVPPPTLAPQPEPIPSAESEVITSAISQMTPARVRAIQEEVAAQYGVTRDDLIGKSRCAKHVTPRQFAMWRIKQETPLSLPSIGRLFGGRDHTTVLHGIRQVEKARAEAGE
jgi:hypothetical protein